MTCAKPILLAAAALALGGLSTSAYAQRAVPQAGRCNPPRPYLNYPNLHPSLVGSACSAEGSWYINQQGYAQICTGGRRRLRGR